VHGVIGDILPFALAVTISPIPIVAEILLLFTKKPVANATAYLIGFVVGVAAVLSILVAVGGHVHLTSSGPSHGAAVLRMVLGAALIVAAVRRFRGRPEHGEDAPVPKWMDGITGFTPGRSLGVGVVVGAVNPKNIVVGLAAALSIASAGLSTGQQAVVVVIYVVIAVLGVAAPLVVTMALGKKSADVLEHWKTTLTRNNAVVMAVLFLIFGVILIGKGITAG
jgi:threonine/homoserine/homoserine lactone efflux protein